MRDKMLKWGTALLAVLVCHVAAVAAVTPGVWCTNLSEAKAYALKNKMPLFCFYGVDGCAYCEKMETAINTSTFKTWMKNRKIVMLKIHERAWSDNANWKFASNNWQADLFPACRVWWPKTGSETSGVVGRAYIGRLSNTYVKSFPGTQLQDKTINLIESFIKSWTSAPPVSQFTLSTTDVKIPENETRKFTVARTGGTAAMKVTLSLNDKGVTFANGALTMELSWAANASGAKEFTIKTPDVKSLGGKIDDVVLTMSIPASTTAAPTKTTTPSMKITVTDDFVDEYAWLEDIENIEGDWESTDEDVLRVVVDEEPASLDLVIAQTGVISVEGDPENKANVKLMLGNNNPYTLADRAEVAVNKGDVLRVTADKYADYPEEALIKAIKFSPFAAPSIVSPKNGASIPKDSVKSNKALADLKWSAVARATKYILKIGEISKELGPEETSANALEIGGISTDGSADASYTWSVTAVCEDPELDLGGPLEATVTGSFKLTVQPAFSSSLSSAKVFAKMGSTISVAASGAPGITYSQKGLPAGMSLNASTGVISGTPAKAGTYKVTVTAKSSNGRSVSKTVTITVDKFPKNVLKGKFFGYQVNGAGLGTAGYVVSISASGAVKGTKTTASGTAALGGSVAADYSTGSLRYLLKIDGKNWTYSGGVFTSGSNKLAKLAANAALNKYSNLGLQNASGASIGYLTVKVSGGKKAKIVGRINGKKVSKSVYLAVMGSQGKGFFSASGISGLLTVTASGAQTAKLSGNTTATATMFSNSLAAGSLSGYKLKVGGAALPIVVAGDKISVAKNNANGAKLSWKKKVGTFKGKFNGSNFEGAFVKVGGVWTGLGVTTKGAVLPVTISR